MGIWRRVATAVVLGFFSVAVAFATKAPASGNEPQRLTFDWIDGLPEKYLAPLRQMHELEPEIYEDFARRMESVFRVAFVDLNGDGEDEMAVEVGHALYGQTYALHIVLAHLTRHGWRYIGHIAAPERPASVPDLYVEGVSHHGWRVLNTGPEWFSIDAQGRKNFTYSGLRHCWTPAPDHRGYQPDQLDRWNLPYDEGGPGYFVTVAIDEECPE